MTRKFKERIYTASTVIVLSGLVTVMGAPWKF